MEVKGYPTLKLFVGDDVGTGEVYAYGRSFEDLKDFVEDKASAPEVEEKVKGRKG